MACPQNGTGVLKGLMSSDVPHQKKSVRKTTPVNPFVTLRYGPKQWLVNSVLSTIYEKQWLVTLVLSTIYEKREQKYG